MVSDLLKDLSMMVVTSLRLLGPCKKSKYSGIYYEYSVQDHGQWSMVTSYLKYSL